MRSVAIKVSRCLLLALFCASCSSSDPAQPADPAFGGAWGLQSVEAESGVRIYAKLESLTGNQDGYLFGPGGSLVVRDAGWCGTPPLTYSNYDGSWVELSENNLVLTYPHWGEPLKLNLTMIALNEHEMRCIVEVVE